MRPIDADELKKDFINHIEFSVGEKGDAYMIVDACLAIDEAPTIEVEPVMHGHWVAMNDDGRGYADEFGCTNCSCVVKYGCFTKGCDYERCPYCGAKMNEVEE